MADVKIGLEIHGYLNMENATKLFCDDKIDLEARPNTNICPRCTGMPGSKPMLPNEEAVEKIIAIASMLDCSINKRLLFQRKHYSWPDLPNGFQRTISGTYSIPVGEKGHYLGIGISDVHLEEDPAKWDPETGTVDYNRSGFPLVEIVTEPHFSSPEQVGAWLRSLMRTLSYIKAINPAAGIKSDVNVSVAPGFQRVEVKNVNSFKGIMAAIEHEVKTQNALVKAGKKIAQETKAWDEARQQTVFMRSKEEAMDYMFIPEPDLPVIGITDAQINQISRTLPERPDHKIEKYIKELRIEKNDAEVISSEIMLAELFERVAEEINPALAAKWLRRELLRVLHYNRKELEEVEIEASHIIQLLHLVESGKITDATAKKLLEELIIRPFDVDDHVRKNKLVAVSDTAVIEKYCLEAIRENPRAIEDYKKGNEKALHFVIGKIMSKSKGLATPKEVNEILKRLIK